MNTQELQAACNSKVDDFEPRVIGRVAGISSTSPGKLGKYSKQWIGTVLWSYNNTKKVHTYDKCLNTVYARWFEFPDRSI